MNFTTSCKIIDGKIMNVMNKIKFFKDLGDDLTGGGGSETITIQVRFDGVEKGVRWN